MAELEEGQLIGSYRVLRCIGAGGMGTVYEVEHVELGVHYALKTFTMPADAEHASVLRQKFFEEGKVLARLKGPHLVHVFDLAIDEPTGMPYFVMDLVTYEDGESYALSDLMNAEFDEELAFDWFKDACETLDYVHEQGIVHRDIKPSNLMLDAEQHVVLADFGVSKIFGRKLVSEVQAGRTVVGSAENERLVMGTTGYMAPEVAAGEEATPAADAYSLGMTFLDLLNKGAKFNSVSDALAFLSKTPHKFRWNAVLPQLLAPVANRRPVKLTPLLRTLDPRILEREAKRKLEAAKNRRNRKLAVVGCAAAIVAVLVGLGVTWFVHDRGSRQLADRERIAAEQKTAFERQIAALGEQQKEELRRAREDGRLSASEVEAKIRAALEAARAAETKRQTEIAATNKTVAAKKQEKAKEEKKVEVEGGGGERKAKPDLPKPAEKMVIVKDSEEVKDYGPIPDKTYRWFVGEGNENPQRVDFQMANGAKIELLPMKKGVFYMSNNWDDKKARHKVTLTRPFWVSKFCVTTTQWREFDEEYVKDCLPIEKALEGKYPLSKTVTRPQFDGFCKFLTQKYRKQIPEGYVFRLPSEAEWEYAVDNEGTWLKYARQGKAWWHETKFDGPLSKDTMCNLVQSLRLEKCGEWLLDRSWGWNANRSGPRLFVGGRVKDHATGLCDVQQGECFLLDKSVVREGFRIQYADEEADPLRWTEEQQDLRSFVRAGSWGRWFWGMDARHIQHVVLGPDLIKEKAWKCSRTDEKSAVQVPKRQYSWDPMKVPKLIKKPKELTFKMVEGGDMVFCTVPSVKDFNMSNPDGQDKLYHKVTLTKPFWITKYCVTTKQWREYAKYDCEGLVRQVERAFPKNPIYMPFTRSQWDGFCEFLNKRYGHQLPKGYVFRLPTEAEWEWAFVGEKDGDVRRMPGNRFCNTDGRFRKEFEALIKKNRQARGLPFDTGGWIWEGPFRICVGGRTDCTDTFGVCDMVVHGWADPIVFDTVDCESDINRCLDYDDREIDPVRYSGRLATRGICRGLGSGRGGPGFDSFRYAHIVVGPDIETPLKKSELEPYPTEDFGGKLLSDVITPGGLSSKHEDRRNTLERFKCMISTENTLVAALEKLQDLRGFHTQKEDSPWIQLNLDYRHVITGIQIDVLQRQMYDWCVARHLRVWTSEDGRTWREVAAENQRKHRYRFDLQRKNVTAKYIRVGREPGAKKDWFALDKILVYGK